MSNAQSTTVFSQELIESIVDGSPNLNSSPRQGQVKINHKKQVRLAANCCFYCEAEVPAHLMTVDHVVPKSQGGPNHKNNLVAACKACNLMKANNTSFLLIKWKTPTPCFDQETTIKLCENKEKLDLYQTVLSYLLLDQPEKAHRVMNESLKARKVNSIRSMEFAQKLKVFHLCSKKDKRSLVQRMAMIVDGAQHYVDRFSNKMDLYEFQYLVGGEIYSDIPHFNIFAIDESEELAK